MRAILLFILGLFSLQSWSQEFYDGPFLVDGKSWCYNHFEEGVKGRLVARVVGDTVVDGRQCKLLLEDKLKRYDGIAAERIWYEYAHQVYVQADDGTFRLVYDFSKQKGETILCTEKDGMVETWTVVDVDTIQTGQDTGYKYLYRRFLVSKERKDISSGEVVESVEDYWVDGIGGRYYLDESFGVSDSLFHVIYCYQGGAYLFVRTDFDREPLSVKASQTTDTTTDTRVYDLQGRRLVAPQQPGIYIRGGKKVVVK